jgi:hypothetical protein
MQSQSIYRFGGMAAIVGMVFSLTAAALPALLAVGALAMAVFIFALYRLHRSESPAISLAGAVVGIVGAGMMAAVVLVTGTQSGTLVGLATWAAYFMPPLVFGFLAYQHRLAGQPRLLGIIGTVGGVLGLLNAIVVLAGGGDYANPNNPALTPWIMGTYYLGMLPTLVWVVWTGIVLLLAGAAPARQPAASRS